ncbi:hypothetical protein DsansV1_C42g0238131 [Dioscorea sansibarensis]
MSGCHCNEGKQSKLGRKTSATQVSLHCLINLVAEYKNSAVLSPGKV